MDGMLQLNVPGGVGDVGGRGGDGEVVAELDALSSLPLPSPLLCVDVHVLFVGYALGEVRVGGVLFLRSPAYPPSLPFTNFVVIMNKYCYVVSFNYNCT